MAEQEPTISPTLERESEKLAKKRAELERAAIIAESSEAFGKNEKNAVAAEGEMTYQQYLEQRPAEGVVRVGDNYQDAQTSKFVKQEKYDEQQAPYRDAKTLLEMKSFGIKDGIKELEAQPSNESATQSILDQLRTGTSTHNLNVLAAIESNKDNTFEIPNYENMTLSELYKEREKAREVGDIATERIISDKYIYEQMDAPQLAREAAKARQLNDGGKEEQAIREALVNHLTMRAIEDDEETPEEAQDRYELEVELYEKLVDRYAARAAAQANHSDQSHIETKGEGLPSKRVTVEVTSPSSNEEIITVHPSARPEAVPLYGTAPSEVLNPQPEQPFTREPTAEELSEAQKRVDDLRKEESDKQAALEQEQKESAKKWWQKTGEYLRPLAGVTSWASAWAAANYEAHVAAPTRDKWTAWLNHGIEDGLDPKEVDRLQKRNRNKAIAAGIGLGIVAAGVTSFLYVKGASSGSAGVASAPSPSPGLGEHTDWATQHPGMGHELATAPPDVPPVSEIGTVATPEVFNVSSGEGGYELFKGANLGKEVWDTVAPNLPTKFPQDFYFMDDGGVGILHPGQLSQPAQDYINSLRQS